MQSRSAHTGTIVLVVMSVRRAGTLAFSLRVGYGGPSDPPDAWLLPLVGDAVVGVAAIGVAIALWRQRTPTTWLVAIVWSAIAAFDALAAFLVEVSVPYPDFFLLETVGRPAFFAAATMHIVIIVLLHRPDVRRQFE